MASLWRQDNIWQSFSTILKPLYKSFKIEYNFVFYQMIIRDKISERKKTSYFGRFLYICLYIGCPISIDRKVDPYNFQNIGNKNKIFWINDLHRLYFMVIKVFFVKIIFGYLINIWKKGKFRVCKIAKFEETLPLPDVTKLFSPPSPYKPNKWENINSISVFYINTYA